MFACMCRRDARNMNGRSIDQDQRESRTRHGGRDRTETGFTGHHPARGPCSRRELCRLRPHRKSAVRLRPGLLRPRGQADRQGQARRRRHRSSKAAAAARGCAINLLAQIKAALGDLDKVVRVVRLGGFINSAPDFLDGPKVLNGASDLMVAGVRRQGPPRPHHRRRRLAAGGRRGRGRRHVRGDLRSMRALGLADGAAGRPSRPA